MKMGRTGKLPIAFALVAWMFISINVRAQQTGNDRTEPVRRTITVTGNGQTSTEPDRAVIRLGATEQLAEAAAAQIKVNETMQKALAAIEKVGIPRRSIRTTGLTLTPIYASQKSSPPIEPRIVAYRAGNTIEVTVEQLDLVGKIIDAGLTAGANQLQGISFGLKNDLPQRTRALTMAAEEAEAKAQTIARALRVRLSDVLEITESGVHLVPQREYFAGARAMAADAMRTPVESGEVQVQATVTVRYEILGAK
jgi:uncharacterized protein YggE